ncbi:MAG: hypothetical protein ABJ275_04580 [Maricaulaceae bacterium]
MRYIAYGLVLLSAVLGYFSVYPLWVVPVALVTSLIFISSRQKWLKDNPPAVPVNKMVDGLYLFFLHLLMNFTAFALGFLLYYALNYSA